MLTYPGSNIVPLPTKRDVWPQCPVSKDSFWVMDDERPLETTILLESVDEEEHVYQTLFEDHPEGEGIIVDPRPILRMRIERAKCRLSFDSKAQTHRSYDAWGEENFGNP